MRRSYHCCWIFFLFTQLTHFATNNDKRHPSSGALLIYDRKGKKQKRVVPTGDSCRPSTRISQLNSLWEEREAHQPHTHTHTLMNMHSQSGNARRRNSPHLLLPHCLVSSPWFSGCGRRKHVFPPPMSHNYLLTAQTNRATRRVTSNQNCHR